MMLSSEQLRERVATRGSRWGRRWRELSGQLGRERGFAVEGVLTRMVGLTLEAQGCEAAVGGRCLVVGQHDVEVEAEVVGFNGGNLLLMPTKDMQGLMPGARVLPSRRVFEARVGDRILGRILDGAGQPIDAAGPLNCEERISLNPPPVNPLMRAPITETLDVGVRTINGLITVGRGQRLGLFAGSGVGKSVLLGMMTRFTKADVIVIGLIGERGREVQEFVKRFLGSEARRRAVIVATPADYPPLVRMHGALLATSIAEYFRDRGRHVLLLMDSLTRFAHAQREVALAIGEPPVTKGYPASVFAKLPQLVERAGNGNEHGGSITALYTVLTEQDDPNDPVADAARSVLDGHIVLSRSLAESGLYPAIDIEASISRVMDAVTSPEHRQAVHQFRQLYSCYARHRDLITIGAYRKGSDPRVDQAIEHWPRIQDFLRQAADEAIPLARSVSELNAMFAATAQASRPAR